MRTGGGYADLFKGARGTVQMSKLHASIDGPGVVNSQKPDGVSHPNVV